MAFSYLNHTFVRSTDGNSITTPAIDTTGAGLIVVLVSYWIVDAECTVTDSKNNTYTRIRSDTASNGRSSIWYKQGPVTSATHTFIATKAGQWYPVMAVQVFSGETLTPLDQQNGATSESSNSFQAGSITPTLDDELVIAGLSYQGDGPSINESYTITDSNGGVGAQCTGGAMAYKIQTTATATNPIWSWTTPFKCAASIVSFKALVNAPPDTPTNTTPANLATGVALNPTLTGSAYNDTESDAHYSSQWQIAFANDFSGSVVWDSGEDLTNLESIVVNSTNGTFAGGLSGKTALEKGIPYYWRVRYNDNVGGFSAYSTPTYFTTIEPSSKSFAFNPFTGKLDILKEYPYITSANLLQAKYSTDSSAPNNCFYWSLTQNKLCYKNGNGVISTVDLTAV